MFGGRLLLMLPAVLLPYFPAPRHNNEGCGVGPCMVYLRTMYSSMTMWGVG